MRDYLRSKGLCLLRFGALNISRLSFDPSIKQLHDLSAQILSILAGFDTLDELKQSYTTDPGQIYSKIVADKPDSIVVRALFDLAYSELISISEGTS